MKSFRKILGVLFAATLIAGPLFAAPVKIFAASSLKIAIDEVIEQNDLDAIAVYGGSAAIARQVVQGAEADIVILAHPEWMDWLGTKDMVLHETRCNLIGNTLVLAGSSTATDLVLTDVQNLIAALNGGRLAVGHLSSVPAGQYTASFLSGQGWLDQIRPHLAQTSNVRLALALVARGEAPLGFVYGSDVAAQPAVRGVFAPPLDSYPSIRYPMALTTTASKNASQVYEVLSDAHAVFQRNGFANVPQDDPEGCNAR